MMEKIILKAQNEEELKNMISRSLTLKEDETYQVKVLKYPKKILFVNIKGEYEIEIVKKSELKANSEIKTQESKVQSENKIVKKETRNYDLQRKVIEIVITRKTIKMKILKMMEKLVKKAILIRI